MSLKNYTTSELLEEIVRRANDSEAEEIAHWCHDCAHFETQPYEHDKYNPCTMKHRMKFRVPDDVGEAHRGQYGFYRLVCRDRLPVGN